MRSGVGQGLNGGNRTTGGGGTSEWVPCEAWSWGGVPSTQGTRGGVTTRPWGQAWPHLPCLLPPLPVP